MRNEADVGRCRDVEAMKTRTAFTLVELMIVLVIIGVLVAIAIPAYKGYANGKDVRQAVQDIRLLQFKIEAERRELGSYPLTLNILSEGLTDPWGNPYVYLRLEGAPPSAKGKARKDKSLVPINSDYDLYSMGMDGVTAAPLTATQSQDDVVRANDGGYYGLASGY